MSNFEYIISSLPYLTMDFKYAGQAGFNSVISDIKRDLDEKDQGLVEFLLKGFSEKDLDADFYAAALRQRNRFLREYFRFDLNLRNAKVRYLNAQLGRDPDMDVMTGEDPEAEDVDIDGFRFTGGEFEEALKVDKKGPGVPREGVGRRPLGQDRQPRHVPLLRHRSRPRLHRQAPHRDPVAQPGRGSGTGRVPPPPEGRPRHLQGRQVFRIIIN